MSSWIATAFVGHHRRLRNGWWVAAFLALLAMLLAPAILVSARDHDHLREGNTSSQRLSLAPRPKSRPWTTLANL